MVAAPADSTDMIDYTLKGTQSKLEEWGHEYLRALAGQIGAQYNIRVEKDEPFADLLVLVDIIVP